MKLTQIAAQLYTVRDSCKTASDLATTAAKLRTIGYTAAQVSGIGPIPYAEVRKILDDAGLAICATHESSAMIRTDPAQVIDRLAELGCGWTAYPYPSDVDFTDPNQVSSLIDDLVRAGTALAEAGMSLGYHNHAIEFIRVGGKTILETIFDSVDAEHLTAELDTYWVQYGGGDPVGWCRRMAGRLPGIHLKDYAFTAKNAPVFGEVGSGNLDFRAIVAAAEQSGCEWFIVEQDTCPGDPFDSLRSSFEYMRDNLVAS